jgi:hypothetical protein
VCGGFSQPHCTAPCCTGLRFAKPKPPTDRPTDRAAFSSYTVPFLPRARPRVPVQRGEQAVSDTRRCFDILARVLDLMGRFGSGVDESVIMGRDENGIDHLERA